MDIYNDGTYDKNYPEWHLSDSQWKASQLAALLTSQVVDVWSRRPIKVVDIGCGAGGVLKYFIDILHAKGIQAIGVGYDISSKAVRLAKNMFPEVDFRCGDFCSINETYDAALIVDVLEHLSNPEDFLCRIRSKASVFLFHIPLDENWRGRIRWGKGYYTYLANDRGHIRYFTKKSAFRLVDRCGIEISSWKYTPWGLELYQNLGGPFTPFIKAGRKIGWYCFRDLSIRLLGGASLALLGRFRVLTNESNASR
jgi:SAM-dependent methyltransferase